MWVKETAFFADLLRPFIVINFLGTQRQNLKDFCTDLWSSATIVVTIFAWIYLFSLVGFYIFRYSFEGVVYFDSMRTSYRSMLTLLTTANFPDVMLPAYNKNFFSILFFLFYLLFGLYFLFNLLLASVFSKFKDRYQNRIDANKENLRKKVEQLYEMFDKRQRGYLNSEELKQLLAFVFDLQVKSRMSREYNKRILSKLGLTEREHIPRDLLIDYLVDRGAMEKRKLVDAQDLFDAQSQTHGDQANESQANLFESFVTLEQPRNELLSEPQPADSSLEESLTATSSWKPKWKKRLNDPIYNGSLIFATLVYTVCLFDFDQDDHVDMEKHRILIELPALVLTLIYLLDLVANFVVLGPAQIWSDRRILVMELLLQLTYWISYFVDFVVLKNVSIYGRFARLNAIFQLRNFRAIELLSELQDFQIVVQTTKSLTMPIFSKFFFLYIIFYMFAMLGAQCFGGEINQQTV